MNERDHSSEPSTPARPQPPTPLQVVGSTIAAAFGVQSSRNRERDFTSGKLSHFIIAGIVFTVLFVVGMVLLVRLVISTAA